MNKIFLDFETYYDKEYSLAKMTTPEYVCDPRFKVLGVALAVNDEPSQWYDTLPDLDYENSEVIAFNCYFDAMILTLHYKRKAKRYTCTQALTRYRLPSDTKSYALKNVAPLLLNKNKTEGLTEGSYNVDTTLTDYALNDNELNRDIYNLIYPRIPEPEREVHSITIKWGVEPLLVGNIERLEQAADLAEQERHALIEASGLPEDVLVSNKKFCEHVEQDLNIAIDRKGPLQTPCLAKGDPEFQAMMREHPEYKHIWDARLSAKSNININRPRALASVCRATGGPLPMPLKWWGAHTGRWSGMEINVQNLPKGSAARTAIEAPKGHVIVVVDSSQIELRINAWYSKQREVLDILNAGKCIYIAAAAAHYNVPYETFDKKSPERQLGKAMILGSGFGMGWKRFQEWCASGPIGMPPMFLTDAEAQKAINTYRTVNSKIKENWAKHDTYITHMYNVGRVLSGAISAFKREKTVVKPMTVGPITVDHERIILPNGMQLSYPNLRKEFVGEQEAWKFNTDDYIYSARLQENCIAEGTHVLTDKGWKPIEVVTKDDLVHDGVELVTHSGLMYKFVQPCMAVDGVYMTEDHEVLTNEGWKSASQNPEPYRPEIRPIDRTIPETFGRKKSLLGIPVRLRKLMRKSRYTSNEIRARGEKTELRMFDQETTSKAQIPRNVRTPGICCMAVNDRSLPAANTPIVEKLRSAWSNSMHRVGILLLKLLARHGADLSARPRSRPSEQRRRLQPNELSLDNPASKLHESSRLYPGRRHSKASRNVRDVEINAVLSTSTQLAPGSTITPTMCNKPVYDILNAGPRQRFVVKGDKGPFIVHNCVQALARVVISDQLLMMEAEGIRTVSSTHDEILAVCPENEAGSTLNRMIEIMSTTPEWAKIDGYPTLTLGAEGEYARNYAK